MESGRSKNANGDHMKKRKVISYGMMIIAGMIILGTNVASRIYAPDASETRLFLDYWPNYLVGMILAVGSYWMVRKE